jgi:energy-coupling factor transporter ATP-binding protein EcfA2
MNDALQQAIANGELILFLGAGASRGCKSSRGGDTLDGMGLEVELAKRASLPYDSESLDEVYSAARQELQARLDPILEELFRHSQPSPEYVEIARFPWRRIYTLNIDDALDQALHKSQQHIRVRLSNDPIEDRDTFFENLDYIKLNGSIDRLNSGIIFSPSEYAKATATARPWYEQCASDFIRSPFLFIGTKLNEPLLKFHIERYKLLNNKNPGKSYVITPSATEIQVKSLLQYNIIHIPGTLTTFTEWLISQFPNGIAVNQLAIASMPQYKDYLAAFDKIAYASLLDGVTVVRRSMSLPKDNNDIAGSVRTFYKGFRPTWKDIIDGIPATLEILESSLRVGRDRSIKDVIIPLVGPAGSGKSTLLMQLLYELSSDSNLEVYFINEPPSKLGKTLEALEKSAPPDGKVLVAFDNVEFIVDQLAEVLLSGRLKKTRIICTSRENIWAKRLKSKLGQFSRSPIFVREFTSTDAIRILEKLKLYGSWTILGQMTHQAQIDALVIRSKQQLLIALLEATYGRGFHEIIESDYGTISSEEERIFLLTVGIITDRKFDAPTSLVDRALSTLGILSSSVVLAGGLAGIVLERSGKLSVRHQVYVRHLLEHVVDPEITAIAIDGLLRAFSHYSSPIIKHINKTEAAIYKGIINHKFLWEVLKGRETLIIPLYQKLEKHFELDGLFWLQYGLSLRDFHNSREALAKLRTAYSAYPADHTQHALGHQLLILANEESDKRIAMNYVDEARGLLEPLDDIIDSDDTYPIVTLAEGHTRLAKRIQSVPEARSVAKSYLTALKRRSDSQADNIRLQACYEKLFKFVATGTWFE